MEGIRFLPDPAGPLSIRPRLGLLPWMTRFTAAAVRGGAAHAGTDLLRRASIESVALHRAVGGGARHGPRAAGRAERLDDRGGRRVAAAAGPSEHRAAGIEVQLLDADEVRELEPLVLGARYGSLYPGDAHVDSLGFVQAVARAAEHGRRHGRSPASTRSGSRRGAATSASTPPPARSVASQVVDRGRRLVASASRATSACRLPMWPAKGYHVEYAGVPAPRRPMFLGESRVVATPLAGRVRLAGTLEFGTDPDAVDYRRVDAITPGRRRAAAGHRRRHADAPSGAARGRSPPTACRWSAARRTTSAS